MKGLRKYLSPFTPDQSGAVSALYELGGIIVIIDAGGCVGNICGFDEPRWASKKSAIFSAALRDLDAILGRDELLVEKIGDALENSSGNFVALVGTPIPSVIGTDYRALKRLTQQRCQLPVITVDTNGMENYDVGAGKAFLNLFKTFADPTTGASFDVGIIGAVPQDLPSPQSPAMLKRLLAGNGFPDSVCYGSEADGIAAFRNAPRAKLNWVVSPSGLAAARYLETTCGTPFITGFPLTAEGSDRLMQRIRQYIKPEKPAVSSAAKMMPHLQPVTPDLPAGELLRTTLTGKKALIIHQQIIADELRTLLEKPTAAGQHRFAQVDTASWFILDDELKRPNDFRLIEEDDLAAAVRTNGYDTIIGDALFKRAIPDFTGTYLALPHFAVSGSLSAPRNDTEFLQALREPAAQDGSR
ncbi:MAG: hypothetical protein LKF96_08440 [Treponema sp.]|jgi:hypothetical protein|nr:hypothetical protein [Treponema sp.]